MELETKIKNEIYVIPHAINEYAEILLSEGDLFLQRKCY